MSPELHKNNIMRYGLLTSDNAPKKKNLNLLRRSPIRLQEGRPTNHKPIKNSKPNQSVHEVHLGRGVLEVVSKALPLKKSQGTITLVDLRLEGRPQTKTGARELYPQISVRGRDLNLHPFEEKVEARPSFSPN
ncbi:hypothetical protein SUGI_0066870 [Cryptomeria japonica]|nr:hypothetical protein SUGI_0066870 [Cryptomeria japonica]